MQSLDTIEKFRQSLGISQNAAKIYFAALEHGGATLTELARDAGLVRTVMTKPLNELFDNGLISKRQEGKRVKFYPLNPQELPKLLDRKRVELETLSQSLLQQISAPDKDMQIRWYSGMAGIQSAIREFFEKSCGDFCQFENADAYEFIGVTFGSEIVEFRVKNKRKNKLIVIGTREKTGWYQERLARAKDELREVLLVSGEEYPFEANIAVSENMTILFEYKNKPFALLIENHLVARSIASIHQMVWDRYHGQ
ncbi:MAG: Transcriptional regulator TrmB [Parcubacteria group bacterium GW2011_GWB1_52_7]|nr:MAG: Transcriptional regulator TrmB [Parcubacteria group bacterium GW2011_GWA1_51_12]KKW29226.1 MAG: Transcriptional regulator TrmB [Parcubacteria group bacterium GW2011_GWB1_52_7]